MREFWKRFAGLFNGSRLDDEMREEMRHHIELQKQKNLEAGMSEKEAYNAAIRQFGNILIIQQQERENRSFLWVEQLYRDIKRAGRSLIGAKGFSFVVIATLALCIGVNTTIFSALHDLVLKPFPFKDGDRLIQVFNISSGFKGKSSESSIAQYHAFKTNADLFDGFALLWNQEKTVDLDGYTQLLKGKRVSFDLFDLAGVRPVIGSFFGEEAHVPGSDQGQVVILPQSVWENEYNSDLDVIGEEIPFTDTPYTIIGVAPRSMEAFGREIEFFIPLRTSARFAEARYLEGLPIDMWARLRPGVSKEAGEAQLAVLETRWLREESSPRIRSYLERIGRDVQLGQPSQLKQSFIMLQVGAVFVLLIGCVNVVNLFLSRAGRMQYELSIRNALGAGRRTLSRLMLIESFLLVFMAVVAGSILSLGGLEIINHYLSVADPSIQAITIDMVVVFFVLGLAALIALIMGLLPFGLLWKAGLIQRLDNGGRTASAGGLARKLRSSMVVSQVMIALTLMIGAGLLLRSFVNVMSVDPGFDAEDVVQARVTVPRQYRNTVDGNVFRDGVANALREVPGVDSIAFALNEPVSESAVFQKEQIHIRRSPYADEEPASMAYTLVVSRAFFDMMGISVLAGRSHNESDSSEHGFSGFVVDRSFAEFFFPDGSAVGEEMSLSQRPKAGKPWGRIVGVVERASLVGLESTDNFPVLYKAYIGAKPASFTLLMKTSREHDSVLKDAQSKLRAFDPKLVLSRGKSLQSVLEDMLVNRRGVTTLILGFAGLALTLSSVGLYGLLSYDVQQRQREIGVRMAIGADGKSVLNMILHQGLWKAGIGLGIGLLASLYLTRFLESQLFNTTALDAGSYLAAISFLLLVAFVASFLPARRAVRFDPLESLRAE